jgi:hypothetical protein
VELTDQDEDESDDVLANIEQFVRARNPLKEHYEMTTNTEHM